MGQRLRDGLHADGWRVLNDTALPLICFTPAEGGGAACLPVKDPVAGDGEAWISLVTLRGENVLRACVTSYETGPAEIDALLQALHRSPHRSRASL